MAELESVVTTKAHPVVVKFPYNGHEIECPFCCDRVIIFVHVVISGGSARSTGSSGFNQKNFSVSLEQEIKEVRFHHVCTGPRGDTD